MNVPAAQGGYQSIHLAGSDTPLGFRMSPSTRNVKHPGPEDQVFWSNKDLQPNKNQNAGQYHKTPYGEWVIGACGGKLCLCDWCYRKMRAAIDNRLKNGLGAACIQIVNTGSGINRPLSFLKNL